MVKLRMNNYEWSRQSIPQKMHTIFEVGRLLGLGRHQTRRRLIASGLPFTVYVKRWKNPATGQHYSRRAIGIPQSTAGELVKRDVESSLGKSWKDIFRTTKLTNPDPPALFDEMIRRIREIDTSQPGCSLFRRRPFRFKTVPKSFKLRLPRIKAR